MKIYIKEAEIYDVYRIRELQKKCFKDDFEKYGESPSYTENITRTLQKLTKDIFYKAVLDKKIVGVVHIYNWGEGHFHLNMICVDPDYQNRGIGTCLVNYVEDKLTEATLWTLITAEENYKNHHFYEKFGYKKVGEVVHSQYLTFRQYEKKKIASATAM
ncbi:MAG: GNAT family N-acetyltransferase [Bacillota bacterium]|nr:GNAT family N-acetyltransferase [Bacillota bacterium]